MKLNKLKLNASPSKQNRTQWLLHFIAKVNENNSMLSQYSFVMENTFKWKV